MEDIGSGAVYQFFNTAAPKIALDKVLTLISGNCRTYTWKQTSCYYTRFYLKKYEITSRVS